MARRGPDRKNDGKVAPPKLLSNSSLEAKNRSQVTPPSQGTLPPGQMPLELGVEVQGSVDGIEMGVMESGIPYRVSVDPLAAPEWAGGWS